MITVLEPSVSHVRNKTNRTVMEHACLKMKHVTENAYVVCGTVKEVISVFESETGITLSPLGQTAGTPWEVLQLDNTGNDGITELL